MQIYHSYVWNIYPVQNSKPRGKYIWSFETRQESLRIYLIHIFDTNDLNTMPLLSLLSAENK